MTTDFVEGRRGRRFFYPHPFPQGTPSVLGFKERISVHSPTGPISTESVSRVDSFSVVEVG